MRLFWLVICIWDHLYRDCYEVNNLVEAGGPLVLINITNWTNKVRNNIMCAKEVS